MTTPILYINDNNLLLAQHGEVHRFHGFAWLKEDQLVFDFHANSAAIRHCRLDPQNIYSRYWQQCSESAIPENSLGLRHAADLIWQQLTRLQEKFNLQQLILVVPSHYQSDNLQLLLGIAQACKIDVQAVLNKAVLEITERRFADGDYLHYDVQLHQTVCSTVQVHQSTVSLGEIEVLQSVGLTQLQESLLHGMQKNFIQSDRFDPLHYAETEQQLFDQLASVARELNESPKTNLLVNHGNQKYSAGFDLSQWQAASAAFWHTLTKNAASKHAAASVYDMNGFALPKAEKSLIQQHAISDTVYQQLLSMTQAKGLFYCTTLISSGGQTEPKAVVRESRQTVTKAGSQATLYLLLNGSAVSLDKAHISWSDNLLKLGNNGNANLVDLLKNKSIHILGDEGRQQPQKNDRLASALADGVISVIEVQD